MSALAHRRFLRPANDDCIDCNLRIEICGERHYIVWDDEKKQYRRECGKCWDRRHGIYLGRSHASESIAKEI